MLSFLKSRMRAVFGVVLFSGAVLAGPVNAQTADDAIFNELLKDDILQLPDPKGAFVSTELFMQRYAKTIKYVNETKSITVANDEIPAVKPALKAVYNDSREEWHFVLTGSRAEGGNMIFLQPARGVIVNHNKWFHYVFLSQDIHPIVFDRVNEKLAKRKKELIDQWDDVKLTISRHGNKIVVNAIYDFINDEKGIKLGSDYGNAIARESDLEERIRVLMRESIDLISASSFETQRAEKDARNKLRDKPLSYLDKATFSFLVDDKFDSYEVEDAAKEGKWNFWIEKTNINYDIFNFGDRLVFSIYQGMSAVDQAEMDDMVKQVDAIVAKKSAKGADSMEVLRHPSSTTNVWVKAHYALNGKTTGKDVVEYYQDFRNNYAADILKKITDISKDSDEAYNDKMEDFADNTFSFLTQDDYVMLAPDDITPNLIDDEDAQAAHGRWAIVLGDEEREIEILNQGDRVVYALAMVMPGEDEDIWAEITDKVQLMVNKMPAGKSAVMEVTRYPGYEHYLWIKATYAIEGEVKGKDVAKRYTDYIYDYSEKLYEKVSDVFEDYE